MNARYYTPKFQRSPLPVGTDRRRDGALKRRDIDLGNRANWLRVRRRFGNAPKCRTKQTLLLLETRPRRQGHSFGEDVNSFGLIPTLKDAPVAR